jgi:hypothetical protein
MEQAVARFKFRPSLNFDELIFIVRITYLTIQTIFLFSGGPPAPTTPASAAPGLRPGCQTAVRLARHKKQIFCFYLLISHSVGAYGAPFGVNFLEVKGFPVPHSLVIVDKRQHALAAMVTVDFRPHDGGQLTIAPSLRKVPKL